MIRLQSLTHGYSAQPVLNQLDMVLERGEKLVISGRSGVGKTTLVRLIAGLDVADSGSVEIDGVNMHNGSLLVAPHERAITVVFQRPALWQHMKVSAHLEFVAPGTRRQKESTVREILQASGLESLRDRRPYQLSEGQARRVAIARAIAAQANYMLMDEPLVNLDQESKIDLFKLIESHVTVTGMGLLFVTHDDSEAELLGGTRLWLRQGRLWPTPVVDRCCESVAGPAVATA